MSRIMVVAGGRWQVDIVKKAKEMGHYVVCSNLYADSPAFGFADACEVADVKDKETNLRFAEKHNIDAVVSDQSDIAIPTVAYIAEKLGLPGIGTEKADICTDKAKMRNFCKKNGFRIPDYKPCSSVDDVTEMLDKYGKIIIKPIDSQSARGVFIIDSVEKLKQCYSITESFANRRKEILAEEYLDGAEFTIDGLVVNGHHYPICVSVKQMHEKNSMVSMVQTYSYTSDEFDYDLLRKENSKLVQTIGLPFGLTHTEYRFAKGQYYLLEIAARGGGSNLSSKIVPYISGVDNYKYLINSVIGAPNDEEPLKTLKLPEDNYAIMRFFDFGSGTVKRVNGMKALKNSPYMLDYNLDLKAGEQIEVPQFGSMRPGHFTIAGHDMNALQKEYNHILNTVKVEFE